MKILKRYVQAALTILLVSLSAVAHGEVIDRIIVVINDEVITQREVDRILEPIYEQYRSVYYGDELIRKLEEARKKVVDQLIEDRLILSEAKRFNIEIDEADLDARLNETAKQFKTKEDFEKTLQAQGVTLKDIKTRYREQLMVRRLIDRKIGSRIMVSPIEINEYYLKHANDFIQPEQLRISNILIRPKKNLDPAKAYELAQEMSRRLGEGGDFAGLARVYSEGPNAMDGGSMGYIKKGDLLPEIEVVIFKLKPGETSEIIQTNLGYHIFKVEDKVERQVLELSEVRREVEEAVFREKVKDKIKGWVNSLKKNAYIAYK